MGQTLDEAIKSLPIPRRARVVLRYQELQRGMKRIVSDPEIMAGEPVFEGTRIPLAHIAGLIAKGVPFTELVEDYPPLSRGDLHYAAFQSRKKRNPTAAPKPLRFVRTFVIGPRREKPYKAARPRLRQR